MNNKRIDQLEEKMSNDNPFTSGRWTLITTIYDPAGESTRDVVDASGISIPITPEVEALIQQDMKMNRKREHVITISDPLLLPIEPRGGA